MSKWHQWNDQGADTPVYRTAVPMTLDDATTIAAGAQFQRERAERDGRVHPEYAAADTLADRAEAQRIISDTALQPETLDAKP